MGSVKTQQVDVRLVSATNASLAELIKQGSFRQDLLYRINTVEITIPPLRERVADILPLAEHFLSQFAIKYGLDKHKITEGAAAGLSQYQWPGNIRELSHTIERAIFLSQDQLISLTDLGLSSQATQIGAAGTDCHNIKGKNVEGNGIDCNNDSLETIERQIIIDRLARFNNNGHETAESLGLSRSSYYRRLEKHKL